MRETVGSLRWYFWIVAVIGVYSNVLAVFEQTQPLSIALAIIGVALAVMFAYLALTLKTRIIEAPAGLQPWLLGGASLVVVTVLIHLVQRSIMGVAEGGLSLLVIGYLWLNVQRLAAEAQASPGRARGSR